MQRSKIALIIVSTFFGLLIAEGITRFLPQTYFAHRAQLTGDPLLGIPPTYGKISEDFAVKQKPEDVFRIVVLGDSQTVSVSKDANYAEVLERLLNGDQFNEKRVEVYNAGAPGHSHYQYYLALDRRLKYYDPDLVIVGPYIGNDFQDLYRNDDRPSLTFDGQQFVHQDPIFYKFYDPGKIGTGLIEYSSLLQLLHLAFQQSVGYPFNRARVQWQIGKRPDEGNRAAAGYLYPIIRGYFIEQHIYRQSINQILFLDRFPKERQVVERINENVTQLIQEVARSGGMHILYMPIPTMLQVKPDAAPAVLSKIFDVSGLDKGDLLIENELYESYTAMLEDNDIAYLRVVDALKEAAHQGPLYDHTRHLTEPANEILGRLLYETVQPIVDSSSAFGATSSPNTD